MAKIYSNWKDYPTEHWRWPDFSPQEMACRGTGRLMIVPAAMDKLQALRDKLGRPMIVNSAYRSPEHNAAVGGAEDSEHMKGTAFDVKMDNHDPAHYIKTAKSVGFQAIGTYPRQNFVHVDDRGSAASWGKPFPKRAATPEFATEEERPATNPVKDPQVQGIVAGITGAATASPAILKGVSGLDPIAQYIAIGGIMVVVVVLLWLMVRRIGWLAQ